MVRHTLESLLQVAVDANLTRRRVALPGRVESYDAATQSASVQPLVLDGQVGEDGERVARRIAVINGVPIVFPGGRLTWPIAAGDVVLLIFASSSIDRWLALGGEVDPLDDRRHDVSDAIAIPGLRSFADPIAPAPPSTATVLAPGSGEELRLGDPAATQAAVLGTAQKSALDLFLTALDTYLVAVGAATTPPVPSATIHAAITALKNAAYLSTIVRVGA